MEDENPDYGGKGNHECGTECGPDQEDLDRRGCGQCRRGGGQYVGRSQLDDCGQPARGLGDQEGQGGVKEFIGGIRKAFPAGLNSQISKVHSAGDTVVVELTNTGKAHNGKDYRNEYCFVFEVEGGKIRRIREYVDMLTVKETMMS